jgi:hypothetical protein
LGGIVDDTPKALQREVVFNIFESFVDMFLICDVHSDDVKSSRRFVKSFQFDGSVALVVQTTRKDGEPHGVQFLGQSVSVSGIASGDQNSPSFLCNLFPLTIYNIQIRSDFN